MKVNTNKLDTNKLAEIITKKVADNLSEELMDSLSIVIRKIVREEIQLHESLKPKTIVKKVVVNKQQPHQQKRIVEKTVVKNKIKTGDTTIDSILNDDSLIDDDENYVQQLEQQASQFSKASKIINNRQPQNDNDHALNEQVQFWNEMVDAMEESARDKKKDTSLLATEAGVMNPSKLYDPKEIAKDKIPI